MASLMASLPDSLKEDIEKLSWINWSEVAREAFIKKIKKLEALGKFEKILDKSEFSEKDILELSKKVKEERLKQLKGKGLI